MTEEIPSDERCRLGDCQNRATHFEGPFPMCASCAPSEDGDTDGSDEQDESGALSESSEDPNVTAESANEHEDDADASEHGGAYRDLYLRAQERSDRQSAFVDHADIAPVFEEAGWGDILAHLGDTNDWIVFTPQDKDDPIYAYTPDLVGDISAQRERMAELLAKSGAGTKRFINCLDGQKASFDTDAYRDPDDPEISGNYGVKGGDADDSGRWLVDIDVDDYDEAKESNQVVEDLRTETLAVASAHTSTERPGHLYVVVDGDPTTVVHELLGDRIDNPQASFGEIRLQEQYCVGPGSEVVCGCDRCCGDTGDEDINYGRYELAVEEPPVVWSEAEFREFLEADPAISEHADKQQRREERWESSDGGPSGSAPDGTFSGDVGSRLQLAQDVDDFVADALREAAHPDDRSRADSVLARAVAPWVNYDRTEISRILDDSGTSKWQNRSDSSYRDSVLDYAIDRRMDVEGYSELPYWVLVEAAKVYDLVDEDQIVQREQETRRVVDDSEGVDTYEALASAEAINHVLEELEERGVDHGWEPLQPSDAGIQQVVECEPPVDDRANIDIDGLRSKMQTDRFDRFLEVEGSPVIWADDAGAGKTTNAGIACGDRDLAHAALFKNHKKALEYRDDPVTPDGYYHLKGAEQCRDDECMRADQADHDDARCSDHGDTRHCPRMCPMYDLNPDSDIRRKFDALVEEVGVQKAHEILDLPDHDDGECAWTEQFDEASSAKMLVGVHEYQTLKTVRNPSSGPDRVVIVDETPSISARERHLDVESLVRMANRLEQLGRRGETDEVLVELADFAHDIVDVLTDAAGAPDSLSALQPPDLETETRTVEVDPENPPAWCDSEDIYQGTIREYVGMDGRYRERSTTVADRSDLDDVLAEAQAQYHSSILTKMRNDSWEGAPLALDALLTAAIDTGLDDTAVSRAIAAPDALEDTCPRCGQGLEHRDGRAICADDDGCGWDESTGSLVTQHTQPARTRVDIGRGGNSLHFRALPLPSELPPEPLVLDATATAQKVAGYYGVDEDDIVLEGEEALAANLRTVQVPDGQYHWSTIRDSEAVQERIERTVDNVNDLHENLLVIARKSALELLDLPADISTLHYHATRGLNRADHDAVVCIGAPHPDVEELRAEAELLAQGSNLRVGGDEHSTRHGCQNPAIHRKLLFEDCNGRGRAVATKHYTGLVGALFREKREKELVQAVHRIRPLLADQQKHAYLLTNVPTALPVDEVVPFDALADPLTALLPVDDRALDLAATVRDAAAGQVDGFRAGELVDAVGGDAGEGSCEFNAAALHRLAKHDGMDVSERTVRRWIKDLEDVGLLSAGEYEQRVGVPYEADTATLTRALQCISNSTSVEVALRQRLASLAANADSGGSWIRRARELLGLGGDRVDLDPPSPGPS